MPRLCAYVVVVVVAACLMSGRGACAGHGEGRRFDPEDATRTVPELIARHNYPVEVHTVTTSDGYILEMHRIPHGRDINNDPVPGKPSVLVIHGLISSSAEFVVTGPGQALGYVLADEGFDVWLGNCRGNYYSRRHTSYNPNTSMSYWTFSFEECGTVDTAAMTDYIIGNTGNPAIHFVGHSQGTTAFFALCSLKPEYNAKFLSAQLLAPVAFLDYLDASVLNTMATFSTLLLNFGAVFGGMKEVFTRGTTLEMSPEGKLQCLPNGLLTSLCEAIIPVFDTYDKELLEVVSGHTPAGAALKQFSHYGQVMNTARFRRWSYTTPVQNLANYGRLAPPEYQLGRVTVPSYLRYSIGDSLTPERDVLNAHAQIPTSVLRPVSGANFSHFDFAWGTHAKELVYDDVIATMWQHESSRLRNP